MRWPSSTAPETTDRLGSGFPMVPFMRNRRRIVLIEGLPGSGKTSLAEWLCGRSEARGIRATWVPELQPDHPVIDRPTMRTARRSGFAERCLERWQAFSRSVQASPSPALFIIEGCLFQSTVRFMVEYRHSAEDIEAYLPAVERCLAPLGACLVYLTQTNPTAYLQDEIFRRKGEQTVSRIAAYSETTPFSVERGLAGHSALVSLYASYREACDQLVARSGLPVLQLDAVRLSEDEIRAMVDPWVASAIADGK